MRENNIARCLLLAVVLAAPASAWAINKCTGPDGKVSYQEASCDGKSKAGEVKVGPSAADVAKRWRFSRQTDDMTGDSTCFAVSPTIYTGLRNIHSGFAHVFVQFAVRRSGVSALTIRTSTSSSDLFHHDLFGTGIKVDGNDFQPMTQKVSSHALSFAGPQEDAVVRELAAGHQFRLRLRFWPYQQLHDTDPISLDGFKESMSKALECAKQ